MFFRTVNDLKFRPKKILKHAKSVLEQKLGIKYIEFVDARVSVGSESAHITLVLFQVSILKFHMTVDDEYLTIDININNLTGMFPSAITVYDPSI